MRNFFASLRALPFVFFLLSPIARTETVTITADRDNTIFQNSSGLSNGIGNQLIIGKLGTRIAIADNLKVRRALIFFDIASDANIPAGATINSAIITVRVRRSAPGSGNVPVGLHRVLANWGEGNSQNNIDLIDDGLGAPAQTGDATWTQTFFDTQSWSTPGGDFNPTPSATESIGGTGFRTWNSSNHQDLVSDVRDWFGSPATNFGWLIKLQNETSTQTARQLDSRESTTLSNRPMLTIDFTPESAMPSAVCQATTVNVGATGSATITGTDVDGGSAGTNISLSVSPGSFTCGDIGDNTVTLTVSDDTGNTSSCSTIVSVIDTVAPTISNCPQDGFSVVNDGVGNTAAIAAWLASFAAMDTCGALALSNNYDSSTSVVFDCGNTGSGTVTFTASDNSSNTSACMATLHVIDGSKPDCNSNGFPDDCEIIRGLVSDNNSNNIPDDCEDTITVITLQPRWNLIGVSVTMDSTSRAALNSMTDQTIWSWDARQQVFVPTSTISPGAGYWYFYPSTAQQTVTVTGTSALTQPVPLEKGWNLFAAFSIRQNLPDPKVDGLVWQWGDDAYSIADELRRGNGYWFYSRIPDNDIFSD